MNSWSINLLSLNIILNCIIPFIIYSPSNIPIILKADCLNRAETVFVHFLMPNCYI